VIAVETNLLVYAHRSDSPWHGAAASCVRRLAQSGRPWAIPWPCVHEFLAIATHPRIYDPPTPLAAALGQVEAWMESPRLALLAEVPGYWASLSRLLREGRAAGPRIHDARVAAVCLHHGVDELWSADRDFGRFPELRVRNPLLAGEEVQEGP
jgi:toxin-antitoxin system PIN domain toxin